MTAPAPVVGDWVQTWARSSLYEVVDIDGEWAAVRDPQTDRKMGILLADLAPSGDYRVIADELREPFATFIAAARSAVPALVRALRDARDERDALLQTPPTVEALVRREFVESELYRTRSQALRERDEARDEAEVERDSLRAENAALEREVDSLHAGREIAEHFDGDDWLRDQHARYHGQDGNMLGREECEWERCEFWDAADWTMRAFGPPVRAERDALREVAEWLVSMDTAEFWGRSERATVTLNDIIIRARAALAAPTGQEEADRG